MPKKCILSEEALENLKAAMARAHDKAEYQHLLCVWLPAALGLSARQVATALGLSVKAISLARWRYGRRGESAFRGRVQTSLAPDAVPALSAALKRARTAAEHRRVECVWLRFVLGLDQRQVATALDCSPQFVQKTQARYLKSGIAGLRLAADAPGPPAPADPELRAALRRAPSAQDLRRAQCLWMLELGLTQELVGKILLWRQPSVCRLRTLYQRNGAAVLHSAGRGGARARLLTKAQEEDLLRGLRQQPWRYGILRFWDVQKAMEKLVGRPVKPSSIHSMLDRHGWICDALVVTPIQTGTDPNVPVSGLEDEPYWRSALKTGPSEI